ncbi:MAG: glycoside hydrolase family 11 protein [Chitinispirillaceae bacterium]|nr:glycoside hydrolase family 11 protein [Chitinispirillaceae bacterium]
MHIKRILLFLLVLRLIPVFAQWGREYKEGDVISSNASGTQGDYHIEYWKDGGTGSMTLKEGGNFSCEWGQVNNILFRKGMRPGSREEMVVYEADYNPQGNSYLSVYGWFQNPLVEYYIIESWGDWRPPGNATKGTLETDGGTYDIHQNTRTGSSIEGDNKTFQQYWSVRRVKRTSGVITCANHFKAWEDAGMTIGKFYEVSFNVEAYRSSGGEADVIVAIGTDIVDITINTHFSRSGAVMMPVNSYTPATLYNALGQKITGMSGSGTFQGQHSVLFNPANRASGAYFTLPESNRKR